MLKLRHRSIQYSQVAQPNGIHRGLRGRDSFLEICSERPERIRVGSNVSLPKTQSR
jgi:hypothetical protein